MAQDWCELAQSNMAERRWPAHEGSLPMTMFEDWEPKQRKKVQHHHRRKSCTILTVTNEHLTVLSEPQGIWVAAVEEAMKLTMIR